VQKQVVTHSNPAQSIRLPVFGFLTGRTSVRYLPTQTPSPNVRGRVTLAKQWARPSAPQHLLVELLHEINLFFAHGALDGDLHLRALGAVRSQIVVVFPAIGWSRYLRYVAQERRSVFAVVSEAALAYDGCRPLCPIGFGPETMSDVDVDSCNTRKRVSGFGQHFVLCLAVCFDHQRLVPEVVE
jgi:hypothetical protein